MKIVFICYYFNEWNVHQLRNIFYILKKLSPFVEKLRDTDSDVEKSSFVFVGKGKYTWESFPSVKCKKLDCFVASKNLAVKVRFHILIVKINFNQNSFIYKSFSFLTIWDNEYLTVFKLPSKFCDMNQRKFEFRKWIF